MPRDRLGRDIDYLRISVIDRCNLRCVYCMPIRGLDFAPGPELLTGREIITVARAAAAVGFRKIRLTGGEPTLRADLLDIVAGIARIDGLDDLAMTTNAVLLPELAPRLVAAGLKRLNIHVDTLNSDNLQRVMRFASAEKMWAGIEAAEAAGLRPIKLNCVVVRGFNDADVVEMARLTLARDWHVRFIELMPFGNGECARVSQTQFVPTHETRGRIEEALGELDFIPSDNPADEARNYRLPGGRGVVGFISPVSEPYCDTCNRMRLTADGRFHLCLLNDDELDVKAALRNGNGNGGGFEAVKRILLKAVDLKPTGHQLMAGVAPEERNMFQLGG